jgi:septum formation protein
VAEATKGGGVIPQAIALVEPLVLASRSPQRRAILTQLGIRFDVVPPAYEEIDPPGATPEELVVAHAQGKARSVQRPGAWVLGVDTTVAVDGTSLAKPANEDEARLMIRTLAGREHVVHSGLCLRRGAGAGELVRLASTRVRFRPLDDADIGWYVDSGEWRERAGGYAVQGRGAALVEEIEGDHSNVVGLPVSALLDALAQARTAAD